MGLFGRTSPANSTQEKTRRRDRFFRLFTKHTHDSDVTAGATTHHELHGPAVTKIPEPTVNENLPSSERHDHVVPTSVTTADAEREASDEPPNTVEPTKEVVLPQVDILARALDQLSGPHRDAILPYMSTKDSNIVGVLDGSLAAVHDQKRACDDKRWTLEFGGHNVVVKEKVDKIVAWIDRFKAVGDLVAGLDPIHAGLPWAGVKLLLEASVAEANQMAALLVGCETALYMTNRLKVYMSFLSSLPQVQSRSNLEEALIKMYACVLGFLAQALEIYQQSTWKRTFLAFWKPGDVNEFEQTCKMLGHEVEIEASNADRTMSEHDRGLLLDVHTNMENALKELEQLHTFQMSLERIERKMDLAKLRTVKEALFDGYGQVHVPCHPATRQDVLNQIHAWTQDPDGKRIFWLAGMAGTGKSTISVSVCEWLKRQGSNGIVDLGGSFFFKRGEGDRGSAALLIPTIVGELVQKVPGLDVFVARALDTDICGKTLQEQFKKLILEPLKNVASNAQCPTLVVVVDALDECAKVEDIHDVLALWHSLPQTDTVSLRLFVTTRPEVSIRRGFLNIAANIQPDIELHEVSRPVILNDISTYVKDSLAEFRDDFNKFPPTGVPLPEDWPAQSALLAIANLAAPLFIVAATICRFLSDATADPEDQLAAVLQKREVGQMAQTYMPVLAQFASAATDSMTREEICHDFRVIVGAIISLAEPLSQAALADLLNLKKSLVSRRLYNLYSVLQIPGDPELPVRPLHLSFGEFLTSETFKDEAFSVDTRATHRMLWQRCLRLLSGTDGLREDICNLKHPGYLRREVSPTLVNQHLRSAIQYACRYWVYHVQSSTFALSDEDEVHTFLQRHFLHWLEALSLLDRLADAVELINILKLRTGPDNSGQVAIFLEDARRFLLANRSVADRAPLQVYSSALAFAPQSSIVRRHCGPPAAWISHCPITSLTWSLELQKLEGHTDTVNAVAFSPGGSLLASASWDRTVRLWQVSTGQEVQKLEGYLDPVNAVTFSPDGSLLASTSDDPTIRLWRISTGQAKILRGHTGGVRAVAFSPDGSLLASASNDRTVRLWQVSTSQDSTSQEVQKLEGHTDSVKAVAFSPDGSLLASASDDRTVRLWQVSTGQEVQKLEEHTDFVNAVAFSLNGSLLASASDDRTVRLWQVSTGQEVQKFEGHASFVNAVTFSPDGSLLASASYDRTIRLWQVSTGQEVQKLEGHTDPVNDVTFSPDGSLLASASDDQTVRLWQANTGQKIQKPTGHTRTVTAVALSPDGSLLASGSGDQTVRLWQANTGQEIQKFEGHTSTITSVALSPDGSLLASGSWDNTVRLWQVSTGQEVRIFTDVHLLPKLAFSLDGTTLMTDQQDLCTDLPACTSSHSQPVDSGYLLRHDWVEHRGRKLLWLPQEYRTNASTVCGNAIAIGHNGGHVSFLRLNHP